MATIERVELGLVTVYPSSSGATLRSAKPIVKTAKTLGLIVPPPLLLGADEVIQ
jgi:hypothetical protein